MPRREHPKDLLKEFHKIKLFARKETVNENAERGKHRHGGYKV